MKKDKLIYIMSFLLIVVLVVGITITYLIVAKEEQGPSVITNEYYDIMFTNAIIDFDTTMKVTLDDENDKIFINIPDLNEFKQSNSFTIDVKNIGNIDAYVDRMFLSNLNSNIDTTKINIDISLIEEDVIKGSESNKLIITITYNGELIEEIPYVNFDINYKFNEVIL